MGTNLFYQMIEKAQIKNDSLLVVGLDIDPLKIPRDFRDKVNPMFQFAKWLVDETIDSVCAFKPNGAHWSAVTKSDIGDSDDSGEEQLIQTVEYIHDNCDIPVVLDVKRGDIGSTAKKYGLEVFEKYAVDGATFNPYLGGDAVSPLLDWTDKGIIILCRTSNPGAKDFQDLSVIYQGETIPFYEVVARKVFSEWNESHNCCLVMGGIRPDDDAALTAMKKVRALVGDDIMFLVPGIWEQGGDVEITVDAGKDSKGRKMIINTSSGISNDPNPGRRAFLRKEEINQYR